MQIENERNDPYKHIDPSPSGSPEDIQLELTLASSTESQSPSEASISYKLNQSTPTSSPSTNESAVSYQPIAFENEQYTPILGKEFDSSTRNTTNSTSWKTCLDESENCGDSLAFLTCSNLDTPIKDFETEVSY